SPYDGRQPLQSQWSEHARKRCVPWPQVGHGISCERWVAVSTTVSHMTASPPVARCCGTGGDGRAGDTSGGAVTAYELEDLLGELWSAHDEVGQRHVVLVVAELRAVDP